MQSLQVDVGEVGVGGGGRGEAPPAVLPEPLSAGGSWFAASAASSSASVDRSAASRRPLRAAVRGDWGHCVGGQSTFTEWTVVIRAVMSVDSPHFPNGRGD